MGRQRLDVLLKDIESLKLNEGYTLSIPIVFDAITVNLCLNWVHHLTAMLINIQMLKSKNRPFGYLFAVLLLDVHVTYVYGLLLSAVVNRAHFMNRIFVFGDQMVQVWIVFYFWACRNLFQKFEMKRKNLRKINSNERKGSANYFSHTKIEWYCKFWQNIWIIPAYKWSWIN